MSEENKNIRNFTASDIQNYIEGKLSAQEMHAIEKAALDDPFLADAIEGIESSIRHRGTHSVNAAMTALQKKLSVRVNEKRKGSLIALNRLWWKVAAAVIILIGAGGVTYNYFIKNNFSGKSIAVTLNKKVNSDSLVPKTDSGTYQSSQSSAQNPDVAISENKSRRKEVQSNNRRPAGKANTPSKSKEPGTPFNEQRATLSVSKQNSKVSPNENHKSADADSVSLAIADDVHDIAMAKNLPSFDKSNHGNEFVGRVVDIYSQPISGAYVNIINQKNATITDEKGMFKLYSSKADSILNISVSSVGFENVRTMLINDNNIQNNTINLRPRNSSLSEVVVTGSSLKRKTEAKKIASDETLKNAEPLIGWKKYKEYLDKNKRLSGDSIGLRIIEVISFTIKKNGKLSNFNIKQSYNDDFDDEAIRLIKKGPAWRLLKGKKTRATITIEF